MRRMRPPGWYDRFPTEREAMSRLCAAAEELKRERALSDPSDDDVLIAAAELAELPTDLDSLTEGQRASIVGAYDTATEEE